MVAPTHSVVLDSDVLDSGALARPLVHSSAADLADAALVAPPDDLVPLALTDLALNLSATVAKVGGGRAFRRRLLELGLVPGTDVVIRNIAPMGDPVELEIRGCRISIRRAEAAQVKVRR